MILKSHSARSYNGLIMNCCKSGDLSRMRAEHETLPFASEGRPQLMPATSFPPPWKPSVKLHSEEIAARATGEYAARCITRIDPSKLRTSNR